MTLFRGHKIGLGTWQMGEQSSEQQRDIAAVEHALETGYRLIDTAEMYANGQAEKIVGRALQSFGASRRSELILVSKVLPMNASRSKTVKACEASLKRLRQDYLDVYLLHWPGSYPFEETLEAFIELKHRGLIRAWGVSNFDTDELRSWLEIESRFGLRGDQSCVTNQVFFGLRARGPQFDLLPSMQKLGIPLMAYTPLGSGQLAWHEGLVKLAEGMGCSAAQLALAWVVRQTGVVAIPKSSTPERLDENFASTSLKLNDSVLEAIDRLFPPPTHKQPLAVV